MGRLVMRLAMVLALAGFAQAEEWRLGEMNPGKLKAKNEKFVPADCDGQPCGFDIAYFIAGPAKAKTILYIIGGPGQIVKRDAANRDLRDLEKTFRIVYFDVRGAGLSTPKSAVSNRRDKFIRAKYIIQDIEAIRKTVMRGDRPWDAVLSHSAGSVIAQTYANTHGKSAPGRKASLTTLILSAPISRHIDVEPFREAGIAANLKNILENQRESKCLFTSENVSAIHDKVAEALASRFEKHDPRSENFLAASNDFCYVDATQIAAIDATLKKKLEVIRKHGGASFVFENYDELRATSPEFDREFPYPDQFFTALRTLDRLGSPTKKKSDASEATQIAKIDAALIVSYYLYKATAKDAANPKCNPKAKLFENLNDDREADLANEIYCERFDTIAPMYKNLALVQEKHKSLRVVGALGLNQGIHRWLTMLLPTPTPAACNRGQDFIDFTTDKSDENKVARSVARRVGFEAGEEICAWNPENFKHDVPTLILKGGQDAAIGGCQAEHFFKNGLGSANKQFIEFPEFGHDWVSELRPERKDHLATMLRKFMSAPARFAGDASVKNAIIGMGAKLRGPASIDPSAC